MKIKCPFALGMSIGFFIIQAAALLHIVCMYSIGKQDIGSEVAGIIAVFAGACSMHIAIKAE